MLEARLPWRDLKEVKRIGLEQSNFSAKVSCSQVGSGQFVNPLFFFLPVLKE